MKWSNPSVVSVGNVLRRASLVTVGTAAGQLISFGASLFLVRIYAPETMGVFSTLVAIATCIAPLFSGRFEMAIPLTSNDRAAAKLGKIAIATAGLGALVLAAVLCILYTVDLKTVANLYVWWWAIPSVILSLVIYLSVNQLAVRFGSYRSLAVRAVIYPLVMAVGQVSLGLVHSSAEALVLGLLAAHVITALTLWLPLGRRVRKTTNDSVGWRELTRAYKRFPLYLGPAGVINSFAVYLPQLGVAAIFGMGAAGQFGIMSQILSVPVALIGQSIGYVYVGEVAKMKRGGTVSVIHLYDQLSRRLAIVSLVMVIGVVTLAEPVFSWLLGEEWRASGIFAALFVISPAAKLIALPLSQTLILAGRSGLQLTIDACRALSILGVLVLLRHLDTSLESTILVIGIVSATGYIAIWVLNRRLSRKIVSAH